MAIFFMDSCLDEIAPVVRIRKEMAFPDCSRRELQACGPGYAILPEIQKDTRRSILPQWLQSRPLLADPGIVCAESAASRGAGLNKEIRPESPTSTLRKSAMCESQ